MVGRAKFAARLALIAMAAITGLMAFASSAGAQESFEFCLEGEGAGQCSGPLGLAVDQGTGDVFVLDASNSRINKFDDEGEFLLSFGWGVADGTSAVLQRCGPAASPPTSACFKGTRGSGTGQINGAQPRSSIVVDASGDVYAASDGRVQKFDGDGNFLRMWGWDVVASGPGETPSDQFEICIPAQGDVCKAGVSRAVPGPDPQNPQPLSSTGAGQISGSVLRLGLAPDGSLYVGMSTLSSGSPGFPQLPAEALLQRFSSSGAYLGTFPVAAPGHIMRSIVVDSTGIVYVHVDGGGVPTRKYSSDGTPLGEVTFQSVNLAIGSDDVVYSARNELQYGTAAMFDVSGGGASPIRRFWYEPLAAGSAIADNGIVPSVDGAGVFVTVERGLSVAPDRIVFVPFPPAGPIIAPEDVVAPSIGNVKATLSALINPEGEATDYWFEYVNETSYLADKAGGGDGFGGPGVIITPSAEMLEQDFVLHEVQVNIGCPDPVTEAGEEGKCLEPETRYRFRVHAEHANGDVGTGPVEGEPFETRPSLDLGEAWSTDVGAESARFHGMVNPLGIPTIGWFEYVDAATCQEDVEASGPEHCFDRATQVPNVGGGANPIDLGVGEEMIRASIATGGLEPDTSYHYRLIADNPLVAPVAGPERTLRTFALPASLPACENDEYRLGPGAQLPNCRAYELVSPLDKGNGDVVTKWSTLNFPAAHYQSAVAGEKLSYSAFRSFGDAESAPFTSQYMATRDDEAEAWINHGISPPRGKNLLGQSFTLDNEYQLFSDDLCTAWLRHDSDPPKAPGAVEGYANLYKRHNCGAGAGSYEAITTVEPVGGPPPTLYKPELQAVSGDGSHAIYRVDAALADDAEPGVFNVYDFADGKQRLVCVLPGGDPVSDGCSLGSANNVSVQDDHRQRTVTHAISEDGSRVFWSAGSADANGRDLFMRRNGHNAGNECVNPVRPCTVAVGRGQYWAAASDGSAVLYVAPDTASSPDGELRRYLVDSQTTEVIATGAVGVLGASGDLSRIYFVSRDDLEAGAVDDEPNLYFHEDAEGGDRRELIGTLVEDDASLERPPSPINLRPVLRTSRVSTDGTHAVFMSAASLTDYDNVDADHGEPAAEVFRYSAATGDLDCISCNPTGVRPRGEAFQVATSESGVWAAAALPTATNQLYSSRVMSDDGQRVFFESYEGLVLTDTNGVKDVYQWEAVGKDDCDLGSAAFSETAGGCVSRLSAGTEPADFIDASADGTDVFITTGTSLVSYDPGLVDVYDVRAGGGLPPPPVNPEICEGGVEVCGNPPPPPPSVVPASGQQGRGNVRPDGPSCNEPVRKAKQAKAQAKRAGVRARKAPSQQAAKKLRKQAERSSAKAKRLTAKVKRCRTGSQGGSAR